jgi:hypothetical protein
MYDELKSLYRDLQKRAAKSPLMAVLLFGLIPFPILAILVLAERWLKIESPDDPAIACRLVRRAVMARGRDDGRDSSFSPL